MKRQLTFLMAIICLFFFMPNNAMHAQSTAKKTETFKVYGNCGMCKETIESALIKKDGIAKKDWNKKTKMLTVSFDESKISLQQIKQKLADVGYDTDELQAKDEVYNNLPDCCKYTRAKK